MDKCNCDQSLEYLELLEELKDDLRMRAEVDSAGTAVVSLSHSLWVRLLEATRVAS